MVYKDETLQDLSTKLPDKIDDRTERTFGATNIDRVLKKFYYCVFVNEPGTQYSESETLAEEWDSYPHMERKPFSMAERAARMSTFAYSMS